MDYQETGSSDLVQGVSHDPSDDTLTVHFKNGRIYDFAGVPQNVVDQMVTADSVGRFFHQWVKPYYSGSEVTEDQ